MSSQRSENLRLLIVHRFASNQSIFARAIGRSSAQVHQWLTGHRNLGDAGAYNIERTLKLPQGWLDAPHELEEFTSVAHEATAQGAEQKNNPEKAQINHVIPFNAIPLRQIPILTIQQVEKWLEVGDIQIAEGRLMPIIDDSLSASTFGFRIEDDSMASELSVGDNISCDPKILPVPGCYVLARLLAKPMQALVRRYSVLGLDEAGEHIFELLPLSHHYPKLQSSSAKLEIIATVAGSYKKLLAR